MVKPLSSIQSERITSSALEVLDSASQTYNSWLNANEQIATTLSNLPLTGVDILIAETNLVNIVTQQQATSIVITARYDKFIGKVDELLKTVDLSVELIRKRDMSAPITGGASGSSSVTNKPIQ